MKSVGCCGGWYGRTPQSSLRLASSAQGTPFGCPKGEPIHKLANAVSNKVDRLHQKAPEYQHYQYRQGQQPALASPRRTARYERIPPDGFDMAALEITLDVKIPPALCATSLFKGGFFTQAFSHSFQGRLIAVDLQTPYEIKLTACTRKHLNINITDTGKGNNRRWQAPGGQREQRANSAGRFRHGCTRNYT